MLITRLLRKSEPLRKEIEMNYILENDLILKCHEATLHSLDFLNNCDYYY